MNQLQLTFESAIPVQNNRESQRQVESNLKHFTGQNLKVFDYLMNGKRLNSTTGIQLFRIIDMRARMHAIKNAGFKFHIEVIPNSHGMKEWFMTKEDIEFNLNKITTSQK